MPKSARYHIDRLDTEQVDRLDFDSIQIPWFKQHLDNGRLRVEELPLEQFVVTKRLLSCGSISNACCWDIQYTLLER